MLDNLCTWLQDGPTLIAIIERIGLCVMMATIDIMLLFLYNHSLLWKMAGRERHVAPWKRAFGLAHLAANAGLALILISVDWTLLNQAMTGGDFNPSKTFPLAWRMYGTGSFLVVLAAVSLGGRMALSGLIARNEPGTTRGEWLRRTIGGLALLAVLGALGAVPIATSIAEAACSTECHERFVASIRSDEANDEKDLGYAQSWAMQDIYYQAVAIVGSSILVAFVARFGVEDE